MRSTLRLPVSRRVVWIRPLGQEVIRGIFADVLLLIMGDDEQGLDDGQIAASSDYFVMGTLERMIEAGGVALTRRQARLVRELKRPLKGVLIMDMFCDHDRDRWAIWAHILGSSGLGKGDSNHWLRSVLDGNE